MKYWYILWALSYIHLNIEEILSIGTIIKVDIRVHLIMLRFVVAIRFIYFIGVGCVFKGGATFWCLICMDEGLFCPNSFEPVALIQNVPKNHVFLLLVLLWYVKVLIIILYQLCTVVNNKQNKKYYSVWIYLCCLLVIVLS